MVGLSHSVAAGPGELSWSVYPVALLRSTGMPIELLRPLTFPAAFEAIERAMQTREALEREQLFFTESLWPRALAAIQLCYAHKDPIYKSFYRILRAVKHYEALTVDQVTLWGRFGDSTWPATWAALVALSKQQENAVIATYKIAVTRARQNLVTLFANEELQHAVFLSNPNFFSHDFRTHIAVGSPQASNYSARTAEATAHRYLLRFCTKCETTAFFGPVLYFRFDPDEALALRIGRQTQPQVFVEASAWVIEELGRILANQLPLERLRPRRNPLFADGGDGTVVRVLDNHRVRLSGSALALWSVLDGERNLREAGELAQIPKGQLSNLIKALGPLVVTPWEVSATDLRPLRSLATIDTDDGPARQLLRLLEEFAHASWPERCEHFGAATRFCESLGITSHRSTGTHYADRTVLHEDRASPFNLGVIIGAPALNSLQSALGAVLPVCFLGALLIREDARESLRGILGGVEQPLAQLAAQELPLLQRRFTALQDVLVNLVKENIGHDHAVHLRSVDIAERVAPLWADIPTEGEILACLPSPDFMAIGPDLANATWLLSELHDDASSIFGGFYAALHPEAEQLRAHFESTVIELFDPTRMATIISRRRSKHITPEMPGIAIELTGRSSKARGETVPIAAVTVDPSGRYVCIGKQQRQLYPGDLSSVLHRALALPALSHVDIDLGPSTPRIYIDGMIYQRARWRIELPTSDTGLDRWWCLHTLRRQYNLPRQVFIRHPREPKPLYLDFTDPLAVDDIGRLPSTTAIFSEMLPTPDQAWWYREGKSECAELRMACLVKYQEKP